eukprot:TRINITY_DN10821_c0_g1_i1.p1 TRINITY_DN10821_c0_g1~~TRINITY_DN10821_c0_g1_i1.p1  ORF type:complete len:176 (+),score=29.09 TRINITY_DN10821_c0_g1_i1:48-575(+)
MACLKQADSAGLSDDEESMGKIISSCSTHISSQHTADCADFSDDEENNKEHSGNIAASVCCLEQKTTTLIASPSPRPSTPFQGRMKWADMVDDAAGGVEDVEDLRTDQREVDSMMSFGSVGHPLTCNSPCKYIKKSKGCKDGANCDRCHLCEWKAPPRANIYPKSTGRYRCMKGH